MDFDCLYVSGKFEYAKIYKMHIIWKNIQVIQTKIL